MNFNEAMQMLGNKLQGKYGHLGFKYKKSDKTLTRHSKNFTYMIYQYTLSSIHLKM